MVSQKEEEEERDFFFSLLPFPHSRKLPVTKRLLAAKTSGSNFILDVDKGGKGERKKGEGKQKRGRGDVEGTGDGRRTKRRRRRKKEEEEEEEGQPPEEEKCQDSFCSHALSPSFPPFGGAVKETGGRGGTEAVPFPLHVQY